MNHGLFTVHFSIYRPTFPYGPNLGKKKKIYIYIIDYYCFLPILHKIMRLKTLKGDLQTIGGGFFFNIFLFISGLLTEERIQLSCGGSKCDITLNQNAGSRLSVTAGKRKHALL